ncbi:C6 transcription factor [Fusarium denticulatum]|uniref:C6 transcription factor n=1 Tax=Fusarium denticulatum TaxID=48507 RepID=A0A8H5WWV4_9HYPO|nr:C6 transcription factor [Fusarium denticulatum]
MDNDNPTQPEQTAQASEAGLACNCCRKRQDCVYETKRGRPGMKAGAIENVHKRLDTLERTIAKQQKELESLRAKEASASQTSSQQVVDGQTLLFSLAREISKLGNPALSASPDASIDSIHKRRRTEAQVEYRERSQYAVNQPTLPDDVILYQVIDAYFRQIHPWIPMIHEARFRKRLQGHGDDRSLLPVLHAMTLSASHRVSRRDIAEIAHSLIGNREDVRDWVVSKATRSLTVESLQALIIICFRDIGDGEECRAWSLIGALTRMVEYLQLTIESEEANLSSFSRSYISLHPPQGWTEAEERRRVFWCVFNLDRFCSFTTAWNTSLTSDDVNRRLPCDGISWRKEETVFTPYFGIWDKSAARIGNPIAFLPLHSTTAPATVDEGGFTPSEATTSPGAAASSVDMSTVGAFAYCIEATESLSRVTSYFLQQKVNIKDHNDLGSWLTRFKELDVRLVHWKMLLPKKWKVNIAQQSSRMDPNLTLAHVTHNASMILLHQPIAFPPLDWTFRTRLPSICSLDTCQAAAIEIATITNHYLQIAEHTGPLSNQYSFCVYLAARVLLLLWRCHATDALSSEFWVLIQSLETMAERWAGPHQLESKENLASKYQAVLVDLHTRCVQDVSFNINPSAYTTEVKHYRSLPEHLDAAPRLQGYQSVRHPARENGDPSFTGNVSGNTCYPDATPSFVNAQAGQRSGSVGSGDLGVISQMLLDAEFIDMDRVISFDDGIFGTEHESGCF